MSIIGDEKVIITPLKGQAVGGDVRQWGGSLNTQYSIIDPWTLNHETQTYNTIQGLRVRVPVEMSDRGGGSLNTQYSIIDPWTLTKP